jgi:bifunctional DNA-binding transcriptional regulator/antitoxin component of YhaV-PrlF toxin-antitoxin module
MDTIVMGKRGTLVIPAKMRKQYGWDEGVPFHVEARDGGFFCKPAISPPVEVEIYTPERLAEFFLNNAMDEEDYHEARQEVLAMGIDPDTINHFPWPR